MRRFSTLLAALFALTIAVTPPAPAQTQGNTTSEQIQIWNASLKLVNSTGAGTETAWKAAFKEMASSQYQYRPDLITVLEVPFKDQDVVKTYAENTLGAQYGSVHSDYGVTFCENNRSNDCGNTMLLWRSARLSKVSDASGAAEVERWAQFSDKNGDGDCDDAGDLNKHDGVVVPDQIVARLKDDVKGKALVFSGVHFQEGATDACLARNLKKVSDFFESRWPNRPLTVVTGDFNENVDIHAHDATYGNEHWRKETDTSCWYEQFSALRPDRTACQLFSSHYYDAVWAENPDPTVNHGICRHWTKANEETQYTTADDACTSDRGRIDFVWIRYEDSTGTRIEYSLTGIQAKIEQAGADRGYYETSTGERQRYSDHRALHARIRW